jgi:hypothetical protein
VSNSIRMSPVPAIFAKTARFLSEAISSRLAWLLVSLHAAWFLLAIANMSPPSAGFANYLEHGGWSSATILAGRPFHFVYESLLLRLLFLVDLPSMLAEIPAALVMSPLLRILHVGFNSSSYVDAALWLALGSCQWLVVGLLVEALLTRRSSGIKLLGTRHRIFAPTLIIILAFTMIATPIVNLRSRRLGFRHAAISFH